MGGSGVQPLSTSYRGDRRGHRKIVVDRIAGLMRLTLRRVRSIAPVITQTMQRDQQSAEWRASFLADTGDGFRHTSSR
jgi:hypothetical protein